MRSLTNEIKNLELETLENIKHSRAFNTSRAYKSDFRDFVIFCNNLNKNSIRPEIKDISLYLTKLSKENLKFSTIKRRLVSIVIANRLKGHHIDTKHPVINENLKSIKRKIGSIQIGKKPLSLEDLKKIIISINTNLKIHKNRKIRDKALLLIGFAGGFRRSELVNLDFQDIEFVNEGIKIIIKQDLINHFNIRQGEKLSDPTFGCIIWDALFEPLTDQLKDAIVKNVTNIVNNDPRTAVSQVAVTEFEQGIQIECTLQYLTYNISEKLKLQFDKRNGLT